MDQLQNATKQSTYPSSTKSFEPEHEEESYEEEPAQTTLQEIAEAEYPDDLFSILEQLDFTDAEYTVAYEKLVRMISKEIDATNDLSDLREILKSTPTGSAEETRLISKIKTLERNEIDTENDFDDLISLYQDDDFYAESKRYAGAKLISISTSPEQTKELMDDVFNDETLEYYQVQAKHKELIQRAITELRKGDDPDDLGESIDNDSDELLYLAQQLVALGGRDPDAIWEHEQLFPDNSEALEILAAGTLAQCNDYSESTIDILDSISESFDSSSRIGRQVTKRKQILLKQYLGTEKDLEVLNEHLESLDAGDPLKKELEERIVGYTNDKDDLKALVDIDSHIGILAQRKLTELLKQEQATARSVDDLSGLEDYVESGSIEEDLLDLRFVQLFKDADEAGNYRIADASFAMYQLAKRFGPKSNSVPSQPEPVIQVPVTVEEKPDTKKEDLKKQEREEADRLRKQLETLRAQDEEARRSIARYPDSETALRLMKTYRVDSEYVNLAYKRASVLLASELLNQQTKEACQSLLKLFPRRSEEWAKIVTKLSDFYPKPWYMFW